MNYFGKNLLRFKRIKYYFINETKIVVDITPTR